MSRELHKLLKKAQESIDRKLFFLGWLNRQLEAKKIYDLPVLVGGAAVSFYTAGNFATADIDLCYDSIILAPILIENGFRKEDRYWINEELNILLECPGRETPERINCIELSNGDKVLVSSLEDMIIDRLCAFKFWAYKVDGEWAKIMLNSSSYQLIIDFQYLERRAIFEDVLDVLNQFKAEIEICRLVGGDVKKTAELLVKNQIDPHREALDKIGLTDDEAMVLRQKLHELANSPQNFDIDEEALTAWGTKFNLGRERLESGSSGLKTSLVYDNF
jgi:hypothetical protein